MRPAICVLAALTAAAATSAASYAVYRSENRGGRWVPSGAGPPVNARPNVFAVSGESVLAGTDSGIYISQDEGRKWAQAMTPGRVLSMAAAGGRVFAGIDGGRILASSDHGRSWVELVSFATSGVRSMVADGDQIFAGTDKDGVFVSVDNGWTWTALPDGLPRQAQVFSLAVVERRLYAGLYAKGLYRLQGKLWVKMGPLTPLALAATGRTLIAGHNPGGTHWSEEPDGSWAAGTGDLPKNAPVWELAAGAGLVVAGAGNGVFISTDQGRNWLRRPDGLPAESAGIAFVATSKFVLAAVTLPKRD